MLTNMFHMHYLYNINNQLWHFLSIQVNPVHLKEVNRKFDQILAPYDFPLYKEQTYYVFILRIRCYTQQLFLYYLLFDIIFKKYIYIAQNL